MSTWGIARDMAKRNEENLKKLSSKSKWTQIGLYEKYMERGSSSRGKTYSFKESKPELILSIKNKMLLEKKQARKRHFLLFLLSIPITIGALYLLMGLIGYVFFS